MNSLEQDYAAGLFSNPETPCLSLYQPSHRTQPGNQQDPIRFKNLIKQLEASLLKQHTAKSIEPWLAPFRKLAEDKPFWNHALDGVVVLGAPDFFRVYRVQRPVPELAIVADSFHIKPLLRILQSADKYQVLAISMQGAQLYEGNRDSLDPVVFSPEVQEKLDEALEGSDDREPLEVYQKGSGTSSKGMRSRHATGPNPSKIAAERFFRAVDRIVLDEYSRPLGYPLILAALAEHHTPFRTISRNPLLMNTGIDTHPDALKPGELRKRAWDVFEPHYTERLNGLIEMYGSAISRKLGTSDLEEAIQAAGGGRVATALIEAERKIPGHVDEATGDIIYEDIVNPVVGDLLDDLAESVLAGGGQVVIVPTERMPTESGLACIYRF